MKILSGFTVLLLALVAESAFAYLDPGTGSMLLQVILGGVAAVGVALKLFWHKIRVAVGLSKRPAAESAPEDDTA
jgi:hypothetical protein